MKTLETRRTVPISTLLALLGTFASAALSTIGFVPLVGRAVSGASPQAHLIADLLGIGFGVVPAIVALWALWTGRRWAPVAVTIAAFWIGVLLLNGSSIISWLSLVCGGVATVAAWLPQARRYGRDLRADRQL